MSRNDQFITTTKRSNQKTGKYDHFVTAVILSENHGYRMKSYGPLPMISINSRSVLERQVECIKAAFNNYEIIVCAGFESDRVARFVRNKFPNINIRVVENQIYLNSNCCESARLCLNNTGNTRVMFMGGGIIMSPSVLKQVNFDKSSVLVQKQNDNTNFEVGAVADGDFLSQFNLGVKNRYWTEIFYINGKKTLDYFRDIVGQEDYGSRNLFLFEAVNSLAQRHEICMVENNMKQVLKIDNLKSLRKNVK